MKKKILSVILIFMLMFSFGCSSYVEHETSFEALVGTWNLNCVYKNTHSVTFSEKTIVINEDGSGERITPSKNEDGEVVYMSSVITFTAGTDSEGNAVLTITDNDGTSKDYIYKVDVPAQLLHLYYTNEDGDEIHYVYLDSKVYEQNDSSSTDA